VRVNAIAPSQVDSPTMRDWMAEFDADGRTMSERFLSGVPLGRLVRAEDIVGPALFLASDAAAMITGTVLPVDGGNLTANAAATPGRAIVAAAAG
jgi:NAD(P)-dependent dehydrogenase (short-subunit alcohol dehydrogenase family)